MLACTERDDNSSDEHAPVARTAGCTAQTVAASDPKIAAAEAEDPAQAITASHAEDPDALCTQWRIDQAKAVGPAQAISASLADDCDAHSIESLIDPDSERITFPGAAAETLEEELDKWITIARPSRVEAAICSWIEVQNQNPNPLSLGYLAEPEAGAFFATPYELALQQLDDAAGDKVAARAECVTRLLQVARDQRFTCGKWMLFLPHAIADDVWADVARATALGALGCSAKIAPTKGAKGATLCCVYVGDFDDRKVVQGVLVALQALLQKYRLSVTSGFKPDAFTLLDIKAGNKWELKPTIYTVDEVLGWALP